MHPTLERLDHLARTLATTPGVQAVLGLGSAGVEHCRFDEHSDIDFFVIVDDAATKQGYLKDIDWLDGFGGHVTYSYANDPNGRKALLDDGLFLEYAVFTPNELAAVPFAGARVVWSRSGLDKASLVDLGGPPRALELNTTEFHLNEALTNLYVGLHRHLRGEHLTATRFIQVYAVERVLALVRLTSPTKLTHPDPFDPSRRIEVTYPDQPLPLEQMISGYAHNPDSATATLGWLTANYTPDPVIVDEITELLERACTEPGSTD